MGTTSKQERERWIKEGQREKATHVVVICDSFDYEDYPVFVSKDEDVNKVRAQYNGPNMQRVMEVITLSAPKKKKKKSK